MAPTSAAAIAAPFPVTFLVMEGTCKCAVVVYVVRPSVRPNNKSAFLFPSGVPVPAVGHPSVHHGAEGAVRVQREQVHLHDHLQRVSTLHLPQRVHVREAPKLGF